MGKTQKTLALLMAVILTLALLPTAAFAADVASDGKVATFSTLKISDGSLGLLKSSDVKYGEQKVRFTSENGGKEIEANVATVYVTLRMNEDGVKAVLNAKPGNKSDKAVPGSFYFTLTPTYAHDGSGKYLFANDAGKGANLSEKVQILHDLLFVNEYGAFAYSHTNVSPFACNIQYKKDGEWTNLGTEAAADGAKTNSDYLLEKLGAETKLMYGTNYRVVAGNGYNVFAFAAFANGGGFLNDDIHYAKISFTVAYPVVGQDGAANAFYPTVEAALAARETDIVLNENAALTGTVTIPENTKVTVAGDAALTVSGTLKNQGAIVVKSDAKLEVLDGASIENETGAKITSEGIITTTGEGKIENEGAITTNQDNFNVSGGGAVNKPEGGPPTPPFTPANPGYYEPTLTHYPILTQPSIYSGSGNAVVRIDAPNSQFRRLMLNGYVVDASNYAITRGSTIITFGQSYLKTLTRGTYTYRAHFANGYADFTLTVLTVAVPDNTVVNPPKTGSGSYLGLGFLLAACAFGIATMILRRKRQKATAR